ncbi:MAG TPA: hypothetical protein VGO93_11755 [Candidatus Xenobia bacterium]|jgi:hypothetical protein
MFFRTRSASGVIPTRQKLLSELDGLPHPRRIERMARLAAQAPADSALSSLLDQLQGGDLYEQGLALTGAIHARHGQRLLHFVTSPSVRLSMVAATWLCQVVSDDEAIAGVLPGLSADVRRRVLKTIPQTRRQALAERLLPSLLGQDAAAVLPACSTATVGQALPHLVHLSLPWRPLCTHHGALILDELRQELDSAPAAAWPTVWAHAGARPRWLVQALPQDVLNLARRYPSPPLSALPLSWLARRVPDGLVEFLEGPEVRGALSAALLRRIGPLLPSSHQVRLARLLPLDALLPVVLRLAPGLRPQWVEAVLAGQSLERDWTLPWLRTMPFEWRTAQARRLLQTRRAQDDKTLTLDLTTCLPWEEAQPILEAAIAVPTAAERASGWQRLIAAAAVNRQGLTDVLRRLERVKNEQDPVRLAVFQGLAQVPGQQFTDEQVDPLQLLVRSVLEARDTSYQTRAAVTALVKGLLQTHAIHPERALFGFALATLEGLAGQAGTLPLPDLQRLPRRTEHAIVGALTPRIREAARVDDYRLVVSLASVLGKRAWAVDFLQGLLEPATQAKPDWIATQAIQLWTAPPKTREGRIGKLLDRDLSTVQYTWPFLHTRRTDWIDRVNGKTIRGQFWTGATLFVMPPQGGFWRWLPRQQDQQVRLLRSVIEDKQRTTWDRVRALRTAVRVPACTLALPRAWLQETDVNLVEAALGSLPWLDDPAPGLPILLSHLDSDRARVAMYAVPRMARLIPTPTVEAALREVLARPRLKVTVHKEVLRLLGTLPAAASVLPAQWAGDLHRDVRAAILHAARARTDEAAFWPLLEDASQTKDEAVAWALLQVSALALPATARARYGTLILNLVKHPDAAVRRAAWKSLQTWIGTPAPTILSAAATAVGDLSNTTDWRDALETLVALESGGLAFVTRVQERLQEVPAQANAEAERDRPATQRLLALVEALVRWPQRRRQAQRTDFHTLAASLELEPVLRGSAWRLRLSTMSDLADVDALVGDLEPGDDGVLPDVVRVAADRTAFPQTPSVLALAGRLAGHGNPLARRLAVRLLVVFATRDAWTEPARALLQDLRRDPAPTVAVEAGLVFTAPE